LDARTGQSEGPEWHTSPSKMAECELLSFHFATCQRIRRDLRLCMCRTRQSISACMGSTASHCHATERKAITHWSDWMWLWFHIDVGPDVAITVLWVSVDRRYTQSIPRHCIPCLGQTWLMPPSKSTPQSCQDASASPP